MDPIQAISGAADAALQAVRALLGEEPPGGLPAHEPGAGPAMESPGDVQPETAARATPTTSMPQGVAASHEAPFPAEPGRGTLAQLAAQGANPHGAVAPPAPLASENAHLVAQRAATANPNPGMQPAGSNASMPLEAAAPPRGLAPTAAAGTSTPALAMHAVRPEAAAAFERAADAVLMASQVSSLHAQPAQMQRTPAVPTREEPRASRSRHEAWQQADWLEDHERQHHTESPQPETVADEEPPNGDDGMLAVDDPDYASLHLRLVDAGQHAALRELDQRRCVLLLVPAASPKPGRAPARAHLLCGAKATAHAFSARWWPGAQGAADWSAWRLHREGDGPRWRSRTTERSAAPLLLRLAPPSHSLLEAAGACLDIGDARRFRHALGGQWSVLALLCPAWSPPAVHEQQRHDVS